jgi:hypothetical protein
MHARATTHKNRARDIARWLVIPFALSTLVTAVSAWLVDARGVSPAWLAFSLATFTLLGFGVIAGGFTAMLIQAGSRQERKTRRAVQSECAKMREEMARQSFMRQVDAEEQRLTGGNSRRGQLSAVPYPVNHVDTSQATSRPS